MGRAIARPFERSWLRHAGVALICAHVSLVPLVFDPRALIVFALPKALLSHSLAYLLVGLLGAALFSYRRQAWVWSPVHLPVLGYVGAYVLAALFALDRNVALFGAPDRALGLVTLVDNAALYFGIVLLVRTRADVIAVGIATLAAAMLVLGYQAVQLLGLDPLPWASAHQEIRPFASLGNPGVLAQYLGTLGIAAGALSLTTGTLLPNLPRLGLAVVAALLVAGTVLTGTRATLLGLAASGAALGVLMLVRIPTGARRVRFATAYVGLLGILTGAVALTPAGQSLQSAIAPIRGITETSGPLEASVSSRFVFYDVALKEFFERPLLGVGPDNYVVAFPRFRPEGAAAALAAEVPETSTHGWVAHVATDAGAIGLVALLAVIGTALTVSIAWGLPALAATGVVTLTAFLAGGLFSVNDVGTEWLFWLALSMIAGSAAPRRTVDPLRDRQSASRRVARQAPRWRALAVAPLAAGLLLAFTPARAWEAAVAAEASRQARARGDSQEPILASQRAVELDPLRAEYWHGLGLALVMSRRAAEARDAFARAVELAPYHVTYLSNLARAQLLDPATRQAALTTARRAVEIDPNNSEGHAALAVMLAAAGRPAEAAAAGERALYLNPRLRDRSAYEHVGRAYTQLGRHEDAERWFRLAIQQATAQEVAGIRVLLARALLALGRSSEALEEAQAVLDGDPTNSTALQIRSDAQRRLGR